MDRTPMRIRHSLERRLQRDGADTIHLHNFHEIVIEVYRGHFRRPEPTRGIDQTAEISHGGGSSSLSSRLLTRSIAASPSTRTRCLDWIGTLGPIAWSTL